MGASISREPASFPGKFREETSTSAVVDVACTRSDIIKNFIYPDGFYSRNVRLAEGSITHPLELEAIGLSFEAPTPEGPTSAASPSKSSKMMK